VKVTGGRRRVGMFVSYTSRAVDMHSTSLRRSKFSEKDAQVHSTGLLPKDGFLEV